MYWAAQVVLPCAFEEKMSVLQVPDMVNLLQQQGVHVL
jgi:hypothetical protein